MRHGEYIAAGCRRADNSIAVEPPAADSTSAELNTGSIE